MFELSVACKYLTPRWRQLSVSIISMVSILVIALVVWLIVVFFSVTHGLEKSWIQKLTALTAPIRINPTDKYYKSYYHLIDTISAASDYTPKAIGEKLKSKTSDPYDPSIDEEIPAQWSLPDNEPDGSLKDIVKKAFNLAVSIPNVPGLTIHEFQVAASNLRLNLFHPANKLGEQPQGQSLSQTIYLGTFDPSNLALHRVLLPTTEVDFNNITYQSQSHAKNIASKLIAQVTEDAKKNKRLILPSNTLLGEGILLPKSYQHAGVLIGDRGYFTYYAPTTSSVQEQHLPVYVAGFYDPGIFPIGNKFVLANQDVVNLIQSSQQLGESTLGNGFHVRFDDLAQTDMVKTALEDVFKKEGIDKYWHVESFREFDFTKDLLQQLRSERNLWTLLATVIIIVACSNIISMLIILVNDKKLEIGILRSMGASSASIATIFGICGMVMGAAGSIIGTLAAAITLQNLQPLVDFIGRMQGYEMFNPIFYGDSLPNEISFEALLFVVITTSAISLIAGVVPAIKASLLRPSTILRSE